MAKVSFILTFLTLITPRLWGGIQFFTGSFEEAKQLAVQQGKLIFVDAYTSWCGPCKRMSSMVFTQEQVGEYYNTAFVNLKLDMEKGEGKDFQQKYRVTAFPTLLFLDGDGKVIHKVVGGMEAEKLINVGKLAAGKFNPSSSLDKQYADGDRTPAFMAQYIEALSKSNRPVLKIANEYLATQKNLKTDENLRILFFSLWETDSRLFDLYLENKKDIETIFGNTASEDQIAKAADRTINKAVEFENDDLFEDAVNKVKKYAPLKWKEFQYDAPMKYYSKTGQWDKYLEAAKDYAKLGISNKFELANTIFHQYKSQPSLMKQAEIWSLEAANQIPNEQHCFIAAQLLFSNGNWQKSKVYAEKALKFAEASNTSGALSHIQKLVSLIDEKLSSN